MLKKGQVDDFVLLGIAIVLIIIGGIFFAVLSKTHSDELNANKQVFIESETGMMDTNLLTLDLLTILDTQISEKYTFQQIILESTDPDKQAELSEYLTLYNSESYCQLSIINILESGLLDTNNGWKIEVFDGEERVFYCSPASVTSDTTTSVMVPSKDTSKQLEIRYTTQWTKKQHG